jgi:hypothetical protein
MKERLNKLLTVKSIVTFVVIAVFAIMAMRGEVTADNVMYIVTTVIAFYFGTQTGKDA